MRIEASNCDEKDLPKVGAEIWVIFGRNIFRATYLSKGCNLEGKFFAVEKDGKRLLDNRIFTEYKDAILYLKSKYMLIIESNSKELEEYYEKLKEIERRIAENESRKKDISNQIAILDEELVRIDPSTISVHKKKVQPKQSLKALASELLRGMKQR